MEQFFKVNIMKSFSDLCQLYDMFILNFPGFISIRDSDHRIIYLNEHFQNWANEYIGFDIIGMTNEQVAHLSEDNVGDLFRECHDLTISYIYNHDSNNKVIKFVDGSDIKYFDILKFKCSSGNNDYIFTLGKDITSLYNESKNYEIQSYTDDLTGLHNRKILKRIDFSANSLFLYIDLDGFKNVNDKHGHLIGDQVLVTFSQLLKKSFRKDKDHIIRVGGDEFLIIVDSESSFNLFDKMLNIQREFAKLFSSYQGLSFSYGQAKFSKDLNSTLEIIDRLMYEHKSNKSMSCM
ncbi:TPA: sensor domain-containing diguanylate cyclase [Vibrio vulnificus]|nr:sensor domain-containing diguanylate cyclase [Vibrio vulnificus]